MTHTHQCNVNPMVAAMAHTLTPDQQVLAARVERARQDARIAQLTGEMVTEGWDRATAIAIAREFARAGA